MLPVFYNCIPGVIFLLVLFISNCIAVLRARKKQHGSVDRYVLCIVLILLTLPQLILIFLTAPAMFFITPNSFGACSEKIPGTFL